ncbi:terpene cyclase [Gigaspora margarita]|uniref:Terpene synthase n=1 Tax=Gigaspora margarita TaxID=4874 RepID=A0A8H3XAH8_GIGMA|nr:terpene cyclase [Gigaspora margarita]
MPSINFIHDKSYSIQKNLTIQNQEKIQNSFVNRILKKNKFVRWVNRLTHSPKYKVLPAEEVQDLPRYKPKDYVFKYPTTWIPKNDIHPRAKELEDSFVNWGTKLGFIKEEKGEAMSHEMGLDVYVGYPLADCDYKKILHFGKYAALWLFWDDFEVENYKEVSWSPEMVSKYFTTRGGYDELSFYSYDGAFDDPRITLDMLNVNNVSPICLAWIELFDEMAKERSEKWVKRIANEMKFWMFSSIEENKIAKIFERTGKHPTLGQYFKIRKYTIGMIPCLSYIENIINFEIDPQILKDPTLKRIRDLSCILVALTNDAFSFWKDIHNNWVNSINAVARTNHVNYEEAFKRITIFHNELVQEFDKLANCLPNWDQETNYAIKKWLQCTREMIRGFAEFAAKANRYTKNKIVTRDDFVLEFSLGYN